MAGLSDVPVVIHEANDKEALELAIIENVQRADLNAIEEAKGYERLGAEFGYAHGEIAKIIGKSRSHIANTIRLLNLPEAAKKLVSEGAISAGHARALLAVADPAAVARRIVEQGLTVRDVERLAQEQSEKIRPKKNSARVAKDADTRAIEKTLSDALGLRVELRPTGDTGEVRIKYRSLEQLESLCRLLTE
jgi:ParB family chromosome partitioning protein